MYIVYHTTKPMTPRTLHNNFTRRTIEWCSDCRRLPTRSIDMKNIIIKRQTHYLYITLLYTTHDHCQQQFYDNHNNNNNNRNYYLLSLRRPKLFLLAQPSPGPPVTPHCRRSCTSRRRFACVCACECVCACVIGVVVTLSSWQIRIGIRWQTTMWDSTIVGECRTTAAVNLLPKRDGRA